ncbi:dTDP-4-dehydrorhamnose 3,5-epimerase [Methylomarinum sp. Ch1-1]|uniref:dTDP-4-dehydrorhamnose 3,5-epimerase n=1 Tax=Methylomarinum roseum TaxID=3067653 RepID=A0AAU7NUR7_9GAMM|nr:dTDP-4-dehydrorhamnose 3,5-epimerase [Methylomarinum sp. Ch1-1]MDP4519227.1 dTDP-4-dehydrorhamnose 3,5-epimerase [Methylomarinum sp. Ch1-1]
MSACALFKINQSSIPGCVELLPNRFQDHRGAFVKTFHEPSFAKLGLETNYAEEFYSVSALGVIRGLHFQHPPDDQVKLIYCAYGKVQDAVVDLRRGSPTYGHYQVFEISAETGNMLYIPSGLAHGFCTLSEQATMMYKVSKTYSPACDSGIRWDSLDIPWATERPILSERDQTHPPFQNYRSPFVYRPA